MKKQLFIAPFILGLLLVLAVSFTPLSKAYAADLDITTHHNDNQRTGANLKETILNTSNVNQTTFGKLFSKPVDGQIYTQPLYLSNYDIGGKVRNVVIVATMHNTVYCFDADDSLAAPLWVKHLDAPVDLPSVDVGHLYYADIRDEVGILSTPVIARDTNTIYLVTMTFTTDPDTGINAYWHKIYGLDLTSGDTKLGPKTVKASVPGTGDGSIDGIVSWDSQFQSQRVSLTLANGRIYFGSASFGDVPPYHGWILGYNAATLEQEVAFNTTPNGFSGGVWQSGQGVTVDLDGNIYFVTGNGSNDNDIVGGDSVFKLSNGLTNGVNSPTTMLDWFTPWNWYVLNYQDTDLGSSGLLLIPGTNRLVFGSKEGKIYVLDKDNLGKFAGGQNDSQIVQSFKISQQNVHGTPVYWDGPTGKQIYVWAESDTLKAFNYDSTQQKISPETPTSVSDYKIEPDIMPGGILSVSADGNKAGSGIVWANMPLSKNSNLFTVEGILRAYDASDLTKEIWNSKQNDDRDHLGNFAKFVPPTVVNGKVYMSTFSNQLIVYGLLTDATLKDLNVSSGSLSSEFSKDKVNYNLDLAAYVNSLTLTPWATESGAKISVNNTDATSGSASGAIAVPIGNSTIEVKVTALDGTTTKTYTINVNRAQPPVQPSAEGIYDAEYAVLSGGAKVAVDHTGFTGDAFVDGYWLQGAGTGFTVNAPSAGYYKVALRYANSTGDPMTLSVYINGNKTIQTTLPSLDTWDTWETKSEIFNLNAGDNTILYQYDSTDSGNVNLDHIQVTSLASNALLSNLSLSDVTLSPTVMSTVYTGTVPYSINMTTVTATPLDNKASILLKKDGIAVSNPISLNVGSNDISVEVTAEDGITKQTYWITVTRAAEAPQTLSSNALLSSLSLSGVTLSPTVLDTVYTGTAPFSVNTTVVTATAADNKATILLKKGGIVSNNPIPLNVDENVINIVVTAEDGVTTRTYTIIVKRDAPPPSSNAFLSGLSLNGITLGQTVSSLVYDYTGAAPNNVASTTVNVTKADTNASFVLKINDSAIGIGNPISLSVGSNNIIKVEVTAQDGVTKQTYTITVTRAAAPSGDPGPGTPPPGNPLPLGNPPPQLASTDIPIVDNSTDDGQKVTKGTSKDGQNQTLVTIDGDKLIKNFKADGQIETAIIDIKGNDPIVVVNLPTNTLLDEFEKHPNSVVNIKYDGTTYSLPLALFKDLAKNSIITVTLTKITGTAGDDINAVIEKQGAQPLLANPVDFSISVDGKEMTDFHGIYIDRTFSIAASANPSQTAGIWIDLNNKISFIPSTIQITNGAALVTIHSPHNSIYTVIQSNKTFADIQDHWAKPDIELLANKLVVSGVSNIMFAPEQQITRAEFVAILTRGLGLVETSSSEAFTDVKASDWYDGAIGAAIKAKLISGYEDKTFRPNDIITRQQMALIIAKALKIDGNKAVIDTAELNKLTDQDTIAPWAKEAAAQLLSLKIVQGTTTTTFSPTENVTRAQASAMIKRMLQALNFIN